VTGLLNNVFGAIFSWIIKRLPGFLALFSQRLVGVFTGLIVATGLSFLGPGWVGDN